MSRRALAVDGRHPPLRLRSTFLHVACMLTICRRCRRRRHSICANTVLFAVAELLDEAAARFVRPRARARARAFSPPSSPSPKRLHCVSACFRFWCLVASTRARARARCATAVCASARKLAPSRRCPAASLLHRRHRSPMARARPCLRASECVSASNCSMCHSTTTTRIDFLPSKVVSFWLRVWIAAFCAHASCRSKF